MAKKQQKSIKTKKHVTIKIRQATRDRLEVGRIRIATKTGVILSLTEYIDQLSQV